MASDEHIEALLGWVRRALHRHVDHFAHRMTQSSGRIDDAFVSLREARIELGGDERPGSGLPPAATVGPLPLGGRLGLLAERFGLDATAMAVFAAAAAPDLDVELSRLYTFAWADFTVKWPTAGFLAELVDPQRPRAVLAALAPDAPLVGGRLVELGLATERAQMRPAPQVALSRRAVTVPEPVLAWLRGEALPVGGASTWHGPAEAPGDLVLHDALVETLERAIERLLPAGDGPGGAPTALLLIGTEGAGRRSALQAACARRSRAVLEIDLDRIAPAERVPVLADGLREARLRGAMPLIAGRAAFDDELPWPAIGGLIGRHRGPVAVNCPRTVAGPLAALDPIELRFEPLAAPRQLELWQRALGDAALAARMVERFSVAAGAIREAVRAAQHQIRTTGADAEQAPDAAALTHAVRRRISHALDAVAEPVSTTLTWDDVVLPDDVMATLREIGAQARHRSQVYDRWGFRQKVAYGRGLGCLFAGPPGTGKTMMATILAADLGREIYRVDLSRVVSKWVGETEKNLSKVFDEAEKAQIILFFDEADSLFSNRTEVKGANDRFANMEVNYLLQRMENFDGMSILTTNFERGIDEAFKRRLKFRVQFPLPDAEQRTELWRRCVPAAMPVADDVKWSVLGRRFKLSGGNIKNAVVRAAFYAAAELGEGPDDAQGRGLTQARLMTAAEAELREMGRL